MEILLSPLLEVVMIAIKYYSYVVIIGVILSWLVTFNVINTSNRFVYMVGDFCHRATEPVLHPIRRRLPNLGGLDLSPLILIVGLFFVQRVVHKLYQSLG